MLDNMTNQPSKFRTKNWVEINHEWRGAYNTNTQIEIKIKILKSSLCHYSDAYIPVKGIMTFNNTAAADADSDNGNKKKYLKIVHHLLIVKVK